MKRYSFGFMQDYMSARGIDLVRVNEGAGRKYRLGNEGTRNIHYFGNLEELRKHLCTFH